MTTVFIGGSRRISRLSPEVYKRIDSIVETGVQVIVGDANGADKAVQSYLHKKCYSSVAVFCSGSACRNNLGGWHEEHVDTETRRRDFKFYAAKDREMAERATVGLMLWDGESMGTVMNMRRLLAKGKSVAVYLAPEKRFIDLRRTADLDTLIRQHAPELQSHMDSVADGEFPHGSQSGQMSLAFSTKKDA